MKLSHLAFVLVPVLGLAELGAHVYFARRPPNEAQWREAAPRITSLRKPGDLVVVGPQWAEPAARMVLGDSMMPVRDVARPDESRYETALEISIAGQRSKYTRTWRELEKHSFGKFVVRRLQNPGYQKVSYDFVDHLNGVDASALLYDTQEHPCSWSDHAQLYAGGLGGPPTFPSTRFVCPAPMHVFAGVTVVEDQDYLPRRCIMMHAPDKGHIEARFRDVPLGNEIRGHSGMRMIVERELAGAPIVLEVFVDGQKIGQDVHLDGEWWKPWRFPLGAFAGKRGEVAFRVSSPRESQRQMCWEADTR
ncbi:MAG: hypothetical protein HY898_26355 [Deltaproteobacteria bacterium]|nr:hypothetical protein [Deltaproteobacteria bacterium]